MLLKDYKIAVTKITAGAQEGQQGDRFQLSWHNNNAPTECPHAIIPLSFADLPNQLKEHLTSHEKESESQDHSLSFHTDLVTTLPPSPSFYYPLAQPPLDSYTRGGRQFGALRDYGIRLHAGVDLLEDPGQAIFAVTKGKIINYQYFYEGTYVVTVDHQEFIIRYGEIKKMYSDLKVGSAVQAGQKIALVGLLAESLSSMLHLEKYSGKLTGPFWVEYGPYQRRADLIDPTQFIKSLEGAWPLPSS